MSRQLILAFLLVIGAKSVFASGYPMLDSLSSYSIMQMKTFFEYEKNMIDDFGTNILELIKNKQKITGSVIDHRENSIYLDGYQGFIKITQYDSACVEQGVDSYFNGYASAIDSTVSTHPITNKITLVYNYQGGVTVKRDTVQWNEYKKLLAEWHKSLQVYTDSLYATYITLIKENRQNDAIKLVDTYFSKRKYQLFPIVDNKIRNVILNNYIQCFQEQVRDITSSIFHPYEIILKYEDLVTYFTDRKKMIMIGNLYKIPPKSIPISLKTIEKYYAPSFRFNAEGGDKEVLLHSLPIKEWSDKIYQEDFDELRINSHNICFGNNNKLNAGKVKFICYEYVAITEEYYRAKNMYFESDD